MIEVPGGHRIDRVVEQVLRRHNLGIVGDVGLQGSPTTIFIYLFNLHIIIF